MTILGGCMCTNDLLSSPTETQLRRLLRKISAYKLFNTVGNARSYSQVIENQQPLIIFPGGGVFFWWQAGAVKALHEMYDLDKYSLTGASAGAVIAVLAGCKIDMDYALDVAERLAVQNGIWSRASGLMGIWGSIIYEWLDIVLPADAADLCRNRVSIMVTSIHPSLSPLRRSAVTDFGTKEDLIQACLASVHIPFFLDGRVFSGHRGCTCVDGSLTFVLRGKSWHFGPEDAQGSGTDMWWGRQPALMVDYKSDPALAARGWSFLQTLSKDGFRDLYQRGYDHVAVAARGGDGSWPAPASKKQGSG